MHGCETRSGAQGRVQRVGEFQLSETAVEPRIGLSDVSWHETEHFNEDRELRLVP